MHQTVAAAPLPPTTPMSLVLMYQLTVAQCHVKSSTIRVYDSLGGRFPKRSLKLVADLMHSKEKSLTVEFVDVQKQKGGSDCGLFAFSLY